MQSNRKFVLAVVLGLLTGVLYSAEYASLNYLLQSAGAVLSKLGGDQQQFLDEAGLTTT